MTCRTIRAATTFTAALLWAATALSQLAPNELSAALARIEALRFEGKLDEARRFCREQIAASPSDAPALADFIVALSQIELTEALRADPLQREARFTAADDVLREFALAQPRHPRRLRVEAERAAVALAHGELLRLETEGVTALPENLSAARDRFREALGRLERVADECAAPRKGSDLAAPPLDSAEARSLTRHCARLRAQALLGMGLSYPARTPERTDALAQARSSFDQFADTREVDDAVWRARLGAAICERHLEEYDAATRRLAGFEADAVPGPIRAAAAAERLRLLLAQDKLADAIAAAERTEDGSNANGDWTLARLEVELSAAGAARDPAEASARRRTAETMVAKLRESGDPALLRRAEALLTGGVLVGGASSAALLGEAADTHAQAGQWEAALVAYDRAAALARAEADSAAAFTLGYKAASVAHELRRSAEAAQRFRRVAIEFWENPKAAEAHLLAVYDVAQQARQQAPEQVEEYADLLEEHLRLWPNDATTAEAAWQLGKLRQHEQNLEAAIAAYRRVPADHERGEDAVRSLAQCFDAQRVTARAQAQTVVALVSQAESCFRLYVLGTSGEWPSTFFPAQREAAIDLAELWLRETTGRAAMAKQFLTAATAATDCPARFRFRAAVWQAVIALEAGNTAEADRVIAALGRTSPDEATTALVRYAALMRSPAAEKRVTDAAAKAIGKLLSAAEPTRHKWPPPAQARFALEAACALASSGQVAAAQAWVAAWRNTVEPTPNDLAGLAESLAHTGSAEGLEAALAQWRGLERGSPAGSDAWYRAKWEMADLHRRLGRVDQARKIIALTRLLHPDLGGPEWSARFSALEARLGPATP